MRLEQEVPRFANLGRRGQEGNPGTQVNAGTGAGESQKAPHSTLAQRNQQFLNSQESASDRQLNRQTLRLQSGKLPEVLWLSRVPQPAHEAEARRTPRIP